jgi:DUF4097 and DUF4098 domain-containing protein YvlB
MKKIKIFPAALLIFAIAFNVISAKETEGKIKSFKIAKGGTLIVELQFGNIVIQTSDKEEIQLNVTGLSSEEQEDVEASVRGNKLIVRCDLDESESEEVSFNFIVPTKFNFDFRTNSGEIIFKDNIDGNILADTYGGDILTKNVSGNLKVETKGGDIFLGDITGDCNVNTYGGEITIGSLSGKNAKISTSGGDIKIKKSTSGVNAKTYGGDIIAGDLGGDSELITSGGDVIAANIIGTIRMETYGGDLKLDGAKGRIRAKTSGGNIEMKNIEGSVDIKTMAGSISIELNPSWNSTSRISTNAGSIELTVPSSAKTTIDARIYVQGWWKEAKESYKINSDFEVTTEEFDAEDKTIKSNYKLNGGGSVIHLKTTNDDITIRKSK